MNVVLHHGLFGFRSESFGAFRLEYFKGIAEALQRAGHSVFTAGVNPVGGVAQRAGQLRQDLLDVFAQVSGGSVVIIAHSMGGLDARHLLTNAEEALAARIAALVTVATPHRGSPVADFVMRLKPPLPHLAIPNPLHPFSGLLGRATPPEVPALHVPEWVSWLGLDHDAIPDLTTDACAVFNRNTRERGGVLYFWVAADCTGNVPPYFLVTHEIVSRAAGANDGVVAVSSAEPPDAVTRGWSKAGVWGGIDHLNAVNMRPPGDPNRPDVAPRYVKLLETVSAALAA